jgi:hypothetical protein
MPNRPFSHSDPSLVLAFDRSFLAALLDSLGSGVERTFAGSCLFRKLSLGFGICAIKSVKSFPRLQVEKN